jgi:hypothetical protein
MGPSGFVEGFISLRGAGQHGLRFSQQNKGCEQTRVAAMLSSANRDQKIDFRVFQVTDGITDGKVRRSASLWGLHRAPRNWSSPHGIRGGVAAIDGRFAGKGVEELTRAQVNDW